MTNTPILSDEEKLRWLTEIVRSEERSFSDRLRAMDQLSKLQSELGGKEELTITVRLLRDDEEDQH